MIKNYWFFCVNIMMICNHVWGGIDLESISKKSNGHGNEQINWMIAATRGSSLVNYGSSVTIQETIPTSISMSPRDCSQAECFSHQLSLFEAISNNDLEKVQEMIVDEDPSNQLKIRNHLGTPLIWAVSEDKIKIADYLIRMGANVNDYTNSFPQEPVVHLVQSLEMLRILLEAGANVNALSAVDHQSLLDIKWRSIAWNKDVDMRASNFALELIKYGGQCYALFKTGRNIPLYVLQIKALMYKVLSFAFNSNDKKTAQHFVSLCTYKNIVVDFQDDDGNTLLHHLIWSEPKKDRNAKACLLLEYFPSLVNMQNNNENTALHYAVAESDNAFTSLLVRYGADITLKNKKEETPWSLALANKHPRFIDMFTRIGKTKLIIPKELRERINLIKKDKSAFLRFMQNGGGCQHLDGYESFRGVTSVIPEGLIWKR